VLFASEVHEFGGLQQCKLRCGGVLQEAEAKTNRKLVNSSLASLAENYYY
jgi:hypothetical protein